MFGRKKADNEDKKKKPDQIPVMHYEGLKFRRDYECSLELSEGVLLIRQRRRGPTYTLPLDRIRSFSVMEESVYMETYQDITAAPQRTIKYFLVVDYNSKEGEPLRLAFWTMEKHREKLLALAAQKPAVPADAAGQDTAEAAAEGKDPDAMQESETAQIPSRL